MAELSLPVVDFSACSLEKSDIDWSGQAVRDLVQNIDEVLKEYGFFYFTNHGVPEKKVQELRNAGIGFFEMPVEEKTKSRRGKNLFVGWTDMNDESADPNAPPDRKEAYNWVPYPLEPRYWPPVENFHESHMDFFGTMTELSMRFLRLFALALSQEVDFFIPFHGLSKGSQNQSSIRNLIYPPLEVTSNLQPSQKRLGEHTDGCTFSFILQDNIGGLEFIHPPSGRALDAKPREGAMIVLVADLLQRWSADRYKAPKHRVCVPSDEKLHKTRHSTVFFVAPDSETVVSCVDGSDTYPPVKAMDYFLGFLLPRLAN